MHGDRKTSVRSKHDMYISTVYVRFRSGTYALLERVYREHFLPARQELFARGDILSMNMVTLRRDSEAEEFALITHWANKEAHDRSESSPAEKAAERALRGYLLAPEKEVRHFHLERLFRYTLLYGVLTGALLLLYLSSVYLLQTVLRAVTGQTSAIAIVAATLLVAACLQPLRRRLREEIDRRFYRRRYDAAHVLADFSAKLRNEVDLAQLNDMLLTVVGELMQPAHCSLWLLQLGATSDQNIWRETAATGTEQNDLLDHP
jgi:hypothetical protein